MVTIVQLILVAITAVLTIVTVLVGISVEFAKKDIERRYSALNRDIVDFKLDMAERIKRETPRVDTSTEYDYRKDL